MMFHVRELLMMLTKISLRDMAQFLNISKHTLRYYDKIGLIEPNFDNNGYRYYNLDHYYVLSTIKILRQMDVPIKDIKKSLNDDNLDDFTDLLKRSKEKIDLEIKRMTRVSNLLEEKINITDYEKSFENKWFVRELNERKIYHVGIVDMGSGKGFNNFRHIVDKDNKDILIDCNLVSKYSRSQLEKVVANEVDFYIEYDVGIMNEGEAMTIPSATYAVYYYKGNEENIYKSLKDIIKDIESKGYKVKDQFYEILRPSHLITSSKKAFFTEFNFHITKN